MVASPKRCSRARLAVVIAIVVVFVVWAPRAEAVSCPAGASCGTVQVPLDWVVDGFANTLRSTGVTGVVDPDQLGAEDVAGAAVLVGHGGAATVFREVELAAGAGPVGCDCVAKGYEGGAVCDDG